MYSDILSPLIRVNGSCFYIHCTLKYTAEPKEKLHQRRGRSAKKSIVSQENYPFQAPDHYAISPFHGISPHQVFGG